MWRTATKDQTGVAATLANKQVVHEVYGLGDAGLLDIFFCFLRELDIMQILEQLEPKIGGGKRKILVPFPGILLSYLMRLVAGIRFFFSYWASIVAISVAHAYRRIQWPPSQARNQSMKH